MLHPTPWRLSTMRLALVLLPVAAPLSGAALQDVPAPGPATVAAADTVTHTVQRGETLGEIAQARLGSAARWTEILELNRDRVLRPELLQPGTVLRLPVGTAVAGGAEPPAGALVNIQVTGGAVFAEPAPDTPSVRAPVPADHVTRRALLERRRFEPRPAPQPDEADRTIFHGMRTGAVVQTEASRVLLTPASELPVVQPGAARGAGWILPAETPVPALGELEDFVPFRSLRIGTAMVLEGDVVRATLAEGARIAAGERLTTARRPRSVRQVGQVLVPTGEVEVVSVEGGEAELRLVRAWAPVQIGQLLVPTRALEIPVGVVPGPAPRDLEVTIVAFEDEKDLYLVGDRLFVDAGAAQGLSVGDEFEARLSGPEPGSSASAASFQVVRVQDAFATLRITGLTHPRSVGVGTRVRLTAAMP